MQDFLHLRPVSVKLRANLNNYSLQWIIISLCCLDYYHVGGGWSSNNVLCLEGKAGINNRRVWDKKGQSPGSFTFPRYLILSWKRGEDELLTNNIQKS